jgi:hypothetical protein
MLGIAECSFLSHERLPRWGYAFMPQRFAPFRVAPYGLPDWLWAGPASVLLVFPVLTAFFPPFFQFRFQLLFPLFSTFAAFSYA